MKLKYYLFALSLLILSNYIIAQSQLKITDIGNLHTIDGNTISDCKIGYRTFGEINSDSSNVILWPTWFTGTSKDFTENNTLSNWIDTTKYFVIVTDALSNGISSSPSNTKNFPEISIKDMVNAQYELLTHSLKIKKLYAVIGVSMGGMMVYEWMLTYPNFMQKSIAIAGSPELSASDLYTWQVQIDLIKNALKNNCDRKELMKSIYDLFYLNCYSPDFYNNNIQVDKLEEWKNNSYTEIIDSKNYLSQLMAIVNHNIYKSNNTSLEQIKNKISSELLIIVSKNDMAVNPKSSIKLAKELNCKLIELNGDCGHISVWCESKKVKKEITDFLSK